MGETMTIFDSASFRAAELFEDVEDANADFGWSNKPVTTASETFAPNTADSHAVHPSAIEVVAGIARAAEEGRISAWRGKLREHDYELTLQPDGSWLTCCPAHNDHNPSFVATDSIDQNGRPKLLVYCRSGCRQEELIETLDALGLWHCAPGTIEVPEAMLDEGVSAAKKPLRRRAEAIVPVPADAPPPLDQHYHLGPMAKRWEYRNAAGELVFYVCRFEPNPVWQGNFDKDPKGIEEPKGKTFRPLSYRRFDDGRINWSWIAPDSDVPLYNADQLAANPTAKVVVCEGEKAADAAQAILPDYVAVTWYSGAKAVARASWDLLAKRDVLIWPDHDEAGSKAAQAIVNQLRLVGCASIDVLDARALASLDPANRTGANREPPVKWDAADALSERRDNCDDLRAEIEQHATKLSLRERVAVSPDNIGETIDAVEKVLLSTSLPIFRRGNSIVRVGQYQEKSPDGTIQRNLAIQKLNAAGLGEALENIISFEQYDARKKSLKPVHAPDLLLKAFLERGNLSGLKPLTGVTDIPLVCRDGTLLNIAGYDDQTGIYYKPSGLSLSIPERPTLDDAKEAIETLRQLTRDFPFKSDVDFAAAISAFISAVNRLTLGPTPLHALTAPTPGSGKSLLAALITIVATGSLPRFITQGEDEEELEKRIAAQMMAGRPVINLDNCDRPLKGASLCNLLTSDRVSLRILGKSEALDITSSSFILANGNNMRLANDLVRRTVLSQIDPEMEHPEERSINWDAKAEARDNRGKYVSACLTILMAYKAAGAPRQTTPLGSFEGWSRLVRDAIIWAGLPDPCGNAQTLSDVDPDRERFNCVAEQWDKHFGNDEKKVADVVSHLNSTTIPADELRMALVAVAGAGRDISPNRLGAFLGRYADRPIAGFKFMSRKGRGGTKLWRLEKIH